jgi:radical SAM superfamily enzyme YgiQ (UPF0313 family)
MQFGAQHDVAPSATAIQAKIAARKWLIVPMRIVYDGRAHDQRFSCVMARMQQKGRETRLFYKFSIDLNAEGE